MHLDETVNAKDQWLKRVKYHRARLNGLSPFCSLGETNNVTEDLSRRDIDDNRNIIAQLCGKSAGDIQVWDNGLFQVHNVKEDDLQRCLSVLGRVAKGLSHSSGKYDFSNVPLPGLPVKRLFTISGTLKEELDEAKKKKKPYDSINVDAGDVEQSLSIMNKMLGTGEMISTNCVSGPFGTSSEGVAESLCESLDPKIQHFLKFHKQDFIEDTTESWTRIYANAYNSYEDSFIPRLTELILSKDKVDPLTKLNFVPEHYAQHLDKVTIGSNPYDLTLGENISGVGTAAFEGCELLNCVTILDGCTYIGEGAFSNCPNLVEVTLPSTLKHIDRHAFKDCWQLRDIFYNGYCKDYQGIKIKGYINEGTEVQEIHCLDDDLILGTRSYYEI